MQKYLKDSDAIADEQKRKQCHAYQSQNPRDNMVALCGFGVAMKCPSLTVRRLQGVRYAFYNLSERLNVVRIRIWCRRRCTTCRNKQKDGD